MWHTIARYSGYVVSAVVSGVVLRKMTANPTSGKILGAAAVGLGTLLTGWVSRVGVDALFTRKSKTTTSKPESQQRRTEDPSRTPEEAQVD